MAVNKHELSAGTTYLPIFANVGLGEEHIAHREIVTAFKYVQALQLHNKGVDAGGSAGKPRETDVEADSSGATGSTSDRGILRTSTTLPETTPQVVTSVASSWDVNALGGKPVNSSNRSCFIEAAILAFSSPSVIKSLRSDRTTDVRSCVILTRICVPEG
jgi:hypothetical protein